MGNPLFTVMQSKVKALLSLELRMSDEQKEAQQWQLLFTIDGLQFIVGKGGINTMFYVVGDRPRKICYPDELLDLIKKWSKRTYTCYTVFSKEKELLAGPSQKKILDIDFPLGSYQVGTINGKKTKLARLHKSLTGATWVPIH